MKKRITIAVVLIAFGVLIYQNITAHSTGMTGRTLKPGSDPGCICHGSSPTTSVNVNIIGPSSMGMGDTATFMIKIKGGPLAAAGCDIASSSGNLITSPSESFLQRLAVGSDFELTHTSPKAPTSDTVTFTFRYIAPNTVGTATIYANGNSVNLSGTSSGDNWNYASSKTISVTTTSVREINGTASSFNLKQNFPNPFNPVTKIQYGLSKPGNVTLKVYDVAGKEVATLVNQYQNAGTYETDFNASDLGLTSGLYFYSLISGDKKEVRKMILTK